MQNSDYKTDDLRIDQIRQLIAPALLMSEFTVSDIVGKLVSYTRIAAGSILNGIIAKSSVAKRRPPKVGGLLAKWS